MSIKLMSAVWENGPKDSTQRFVLLALADYADHDGTCFPSYNKTAARCAISRSTAMRAIKALEAAGWLSTEPQTRANGSHTSNRILLNLEKLGGSSTVTPPSSTVTLGGYQDDTTLVAECDPPSSTVTPLDPSIDPSIDPSKGGRAKSPLPLPTVKFQPADRTPGGNGFKLPDEPPTTPREPTAEDRAVAAMSQALTDVTGISAKLNWKTGFGELCEQLVREGYTAEQVRAHYSRQRQAGAWNWYDQDWRGKKDEGPSLKGIRETIAGATQMAAPAKRVSQIDRALAMFTTPKPATS